MSLTKKQKKKLISNLNAQIELKQTSLYNSDYKSGCVDGLNIAKAVVVDFLADEKL